METNKIGGSYASGDALNKGDHSKNIVAKKSVDGMHANNVKAINKFVANNKYVPYQKYVGPSQIPLEFMKENTQKILQVKVHNS